jgi:hypothetical protein
MAFSPCLKVLTMNTYKCLYKHRFIEVQAATSYAAQCEAVKIFKAKKSFDVSVYLLQLANSNETITQVITG